MVAHHGTFDFSLSHFTFDLSLCTVHLENENANVTNPSAGTVATFHSKNTQDSLHFQLF